MEEVRILTTLEEVKAISDPMKYRILSSFNKIGEPATVKQIADCINEVPAKVHYHVKKMEAYGILVLVRTKEIKGIVAKYYEPTAKSFEIKCDENTMKSNRQLVIAEQQRLVSEMYENSKAAVFEQVANLSKDGDTSRLGMFLVDELFLNEQEVKEFKLMLQSFLEAHNDCKLQKPDSKKYHIFTAFFEMK